MSRGSQEGGRGVTLIKPDFLGRGLSTEGQGLPPKARLQSVHLGPLDVSGRAGPKDEEWLRGMPCRAEHRPAWEKDRTAPAAWDHKPVSAQRDIAAAESIGGLPE